MTNIRIEVLNKCEQVGVVNVYTIHISKDLTSKLYEEICELFYNKVIQDCCYYIFNESLEEVQYAFIEPQTEWGLEISFLPGMTDNVASTAKQIVREYLISIDPSVIPACNGEMASIKISAKSSKLILGKGNIPTANDIKEQFNPITEYCTLIHKESSGYSWKYYGKSKYVIPAPSYLSSQCSDTGIQEKEEWIPVSAT